MEYIWTSLAFRKSSTSLTFKTKSTLATRFQSTLTLLLLSVSFLSNFQKQLLFPFLVVLVSKKCTRLLTTKNRRSLIVWFMNGGDGEKNTILTYFSFCVCGGGVIPRSSIFWLLPTSFKTKWYVSWVWEKFTFRECYWVILASFGS